MCGKLSQNVLASFIKNPKFIYSNQLRSLNLSSLIDHYDINVYILRRSKVLYFGVDKCVVIWCFLYVFCNIPNRLTL